MSGAQYRPIARYRTTSVQYSAFLEPQESRSHDLESLRITAFVGHGKGGRSPLPCLTTILLRHALCYKNISILSVQAVDACECSKISELAILIYNRRAITIRDGVSERKLASNVIT